ncbi:DUF5983 family protein, partial [Escherichia coli]|uniref:DUF5983 family protein n=1 Tax=Escherichia coli TaxID=562 RepID=UPI000A62A938
SLSHQTNDAGESEWIHFTGSGYLLRTDALSYPVLHLKRLGLSKTFRRLVVTLIRRYGVSLSIDIVFHVGRDGVVMDMIDIYYKGAECENF